jgi:hypothetical protein
LNPEIHTETRPGGRHPHLFVALPALNPQSDKTPDHRAMVYRQFSFTERSGVKNENYCSVFTLSVFRGGKRANFRVPVDTQGKSKARLLR